MPHSPSSTAPRSFAPAASWDHLRLRAQLLRRVRRFFDERDFVEVETPLLSADTVVDRHLDPLQVTLFDDPHTPDVGRRLWLQTSPEFCMKRLLAAGATAIYQVTRAFRGGETGRLHNPEFTMLEWYRVGDDYDAGMALLAEFSETVLARGPVTRLRYREAFQRQVEIDPHAATVAELRAAVHARCTAAPPDFAPHDRDSWLNLLFATCVEPGLGQDSPTILYDYPASQAALARVRHDNPPIAERFELYVQGVELANGFHELLDADTLRTRNRQHNQARRDDGKFELPEDSRLLVAMDHGLPACTGVALGFDRLVMLAAGAASLAEVQAFPIDIA